MGRVSGWFLAKVIAKVKIRHVDLKGKPLFAPLQEDFMPLGASQPPLVCNPEAFGEVLEQDDRIKNRCTIGMRGSNEQANTRMFSRRWDVYMPGVLNDCLNLLRGPPAGSAAPAVIISRLYFEAAATRGETTVPTNAAGTGGGTFLSLTAVGDLISY